jgi:hypothetical protein
MALFSPDPAIAKTQMLAITFLLTAFGHTDGKFSLAEKRFVQEKIAALVEARITEAIADPLARHVAVERSTEQFRRVAAAIDREIVALFSESVAEGESPEQFVRAKLALRCYELLQHFDDEGRAQLYQLVNELIVADGVVHPEEEKFRDDIQRLFAAPAQVATEIEPPAPNAPRIEIAPPATLTPRTLDHPFLAHNERAYARDIPEFVKSAQKDVALLAQVTKTLEAQRAAGAGRLTGASHFGEFAGQAPFLDGHVYVLPPDPRAEYELIVVGDLHGCYSCLKAVLMQTDFLAKVQAHADAPESTPDVRLILLGDYIDRGRFSFDGVLRTATRLFVTVPDSVVLLRGNHEYYLQHEGRILAPVRPAEAMMDLTGVASDAYFAEYMRLFEALPSFLAFDRFFFVHAGIPRDDTLAKRWKDLSSLNDPDLRFQMMWSDPSEAEFVPEKLQRAAARFGFGTQQFRSFMARIGCNVMVRGHERIVEGVRTVYDFPDATLISLFSAGGATNLDLPESSNYREVTPMALSIHHRDGVSRVRPFSIDWARYNDPALNKFLA